MIQEFVDEFMKHKKDLRAYFVQNSKPESYEEVVKAILDNCFRDQKIKAEDLKTIDLTECYQGDYLFIFSSNYGFWRYYSVVSYGSCSGCDTLEAIQYDDDLESRVEDLMTLSLQFVQGIKQLA